MELLQTILGLNNSIIRTYKRTPVQYIQDLRVTEWLLFNTDVGYSNLMSLLEDLSVLYKIPFEYVQEDFISVILKEL